MKQIERRMTQHQVWLSTYMYLAFYTEFFDWKLAEIVGNIGLFVIKH